MEAPEKLNTDYGQLPPPAECLQQEVPLGSLTPSGSLACWLESCLKTVTSTVQGYRGGDSGSPVHPSWNPGQWRSGLSSVSWAAPTTQLGFSETQNESASSTPPVFLG